jgi:hypothetical protein
MTAIPSTSDATAVVGPAPTGAEASATSSVAKSLRLRLEQLQGLDGLALREEWRRLCRAEPPRISRDLLTRALAYRLQELEFGGLPKWARQSLAGLATATDPAETGGAPTPKPPPRLKPGARLVREWHGRTHSVIVLEDAFEFEAKRYRSLTQIAREITGAHWSGPRFFGLVKRRAGAELNLALQDGSKKAGGLTSSGQNAPPPEAPNDIARVKRTDAHIGGRRARTKENAHG